MVKITRIFFLLIFSLLWISTTTAQDDLSQFEVITLDNIHRLEQIDILTPGLFYDMAWSPDGETIAVASESGVWLFDPADLRQPPQRLFREPQLVSQVEYSIDGRSLTGYTQDSLWIWETENYELTNTVTIDSGRIVDVQNDAYLVANCGQLRQYSLSDSTLEIPIVMQEGCIYDAALSPDETQIAYVDSSTALTILDTDTLDELHKTNLKSDDLIRPPYLSNLRPGENYVVYSPNSKYLIFEYLWFGMLIESDTGNILSTKLQGINSAFSADSRFLFQHSGLGINGSTHIFDVTKQDYVGGASVDAHQIVYPNHAAFSPDSENVAWGAVGDVYVSSFADKDVGLTWYADIWPYLDVTSDGYLYSYRINYDERTQQQKKVVSRHNLTSGAAELVATCEQLKWNSDLDHLYCLNAEANLEDEHLFAIDVANIPINEITEIELHSSDIHFIETKTQNYAWSSEANYVLPLPPEYRIENTEVWNNQYASIIPEAGDDLVLIFDQNSLRTIKSLPGKSFVYDASEMAFNSDMTRFVYGLFDDYTMIFNTENFDPLLRLNRDFPYGRLEFTLDDHWLISITDRSYFVGTVAVWNLAQAEMGGTKDPVVIEVEHAIAQGNVIAGEVDLGMLCQEREASLKIWKLDNEISGPFELQGEFRETQSLDLITGEQILVHGVDIGTPCVNAPAKGGIRLYNTANLQLLVSFDTQSPPIEVTFAADDRFILVFTEGGAIHLYGVPNS